MVDLDDRISIRDYIAILFKAHEREHELTHQALTTQALEYERRLTALNHAHDQAQADKVAFVQVPNYDSQQRDVRALIKASEDRLGVVEDMSRDTAKALAVLNTTITWIGRIVLTALIGGIVTLGLRALGVGI